MEILRADNITKIYNKGTDIECVALKNVSLSINEGDFVCIMGPSGSGKTTLLNNLSTIDRPTRGSVKLLDKNVLILRESELAELRNSFFGYIFQVFNLVEALTVYENVSLPLMIGKKADSREIEKKVDEVLELLDITECSNKLAKQCSVGQRQRAAIARALVNNPKLIVADEPTGNLDSHNSHEFLKLLSQLNQKNKVSVIMVTHDPTIGSYSGRLLYIRDGEIYQEVVRGQMSQKEYYQKIVELSLDNRTNFE